MSITPRLDDYLIDKGFSCNVCYEAFDLEDKKPYFADCMEHRFHSTCLTDWYAQRKTCPQCRVASVNSKNQALQNTYIENTIKEWQKVYGSGANISQARVPENFTTHSFCERMWQFRDVRSEIEAALPEVSNIMNWANITALEKELGTYPNEWLLVTDKNDPSKLGIVRLTTSNGKNWEMHWGGVNQNDVEFYLKMYTKLLLHVKSEGTGNDWRSLCLSTFFTVEAESVWMKAVLNYLLSRNCIFENTLKFHHWGTQCHIKAYPIPMPGFVLQYLFDDGSIELHTNGSIDECIKTPVDTFIEDHAIANMFSEWAVCTVVDGLKKIINAELEGFKKNPGNYFIYIIDGKAMGFVRFNREDHQGLMVEKCGLALDALDCAQHFIEQFKHWAKTTNSWTKDQPAKFITFSAECARQQKVKDAIATNREQ